MAQLFIVTIEVAIPEQDLPVTKEEVQKCLNDAFMKEFNAHLATVLFVTEITFRSKQ